MNGAMVVPAIIEYHSRALRVEVERVCADHGFSLDQNVDYFAESTGGDQEEVGILYLKRAESAPLARALD